MPFFFTVLNYINTAVMLNRILLHQYDNLSYRHLAAIWFDVRLCR